MRLLLSIPIIILLLDNSQTSRYYVLGIGIIAILTDRLDGYFARKYGEVTEFGKIIDPVADKIVIGTVTLILTIQNYLPLWFVIAVIGRDLLILFGGCYMKSSFQIIPQSNLIGKMTVGFLSVVLILVLLNISALDGIKIIFIWLSVLFLIISLVLYILKLKKFFPERNN